MAENETIRERLSEEIRDKLRAIIEGKADAPRRLAQKLKVSEKTLTRAVAGALLNPATKTHIELGAKAMQVAESAT